MSIFSRIPPGHPLTEAARYTNAYSEEHGLEKTIEWAEMDVEVGQLAYLAEQRTYRAIAAMMGMSFGTSGEHGTFGLDNQIIAAITSSPLWKDMGMLLISCYMDGITIGFVGAKLKYGNWNV